ncbi:uncharacterized protein DS421_9g266320 [Arachis hypogaea]|nr:uncharacterized protein DS421_9g266320 [Arachis hypogaea]
MSRILSDNLQGRNKLVEQGSRNREELTPNIAVVLVVVSWAAEGSGSSPLAVAEEHVEAVKGSGGADFSSFALCFSRTALSFSLATVTEATPQQLRQQGWLNCSRVQHASLSWSLAPLAAIHGSDNSTVKRRGSSGGDKASRKLFSFVRLSVLGSFLCDGNCGARMAVTRCSMARHGGGTSSLKPSSARIVATQEASAAMRRQGGLGMVILATWPIVAA